MINRLGSVISIDYDDVYADITVIQHDSMDIVSTQLIAKLLRDPNKPNHPSIWVTMELGKNASGEVCYIKNIEEAITKPVFVPASYIE